MSIDAGEFNTVFSTEVPYLRLHKSLGPTDAGQTSIDTIDGFAGHAQRSIFIVKAEKFADFLNVLKLPSRPDPTMMGLFS